MMGNLISGFTTTLIGVEILNRKRLIFTWKHYGYGYNYKFNNSDFRKLIKMAINGELK
ncbi:hypothetical protein LCGC14_0476720 [marine sediment metagenome]|uniref:Uncharacterized protein n=1 Tax=marine sediment metagenome TaxID=412755 RepID=A0A0F9SFZ2_9ZZZZ